MIRRVIAMMAMVVTSGPACADEASTSNRSFEARWQGGYLGVQAGKLRGEGYLLDPGNGYAKPNPAGSFAGAYLGCN